MMVSHVFAIVAALKSKARYCFIGEGHEVCQPQLVSDKYGVYIDPAYCIAFNYMN